MESSEIQKFLHELNNCLNSANINAALLRRMHAETVDKDTLRRLETALQDAEKISRQFQRQALGQAKPVPSSASLTERVAP